MSTEHLDTWDKLRYWAAQYDPKSRRYAFRGQANSEWHLETSLARHFKNSPDRVNSHEWRNRELKMYCMFRERLLLVCRELYEDWHPKDVLALMQHHGVPTRMLDFTFSPLVAAFFALRDACGDSAIWVIDVQELMKQWENRHYPDWIGPTHIDGYKRVEIKYDDAMVIIPRIGDTHFAAQDSCFLVPGHISTYVNKKLKVPAKCIILSESLIFDSLLALPSMRISNDFLFPRLDSIAKDITRFSTTGSAHYPTPPISRPSPAPFALRGREP